MVLSYEIISLFGNSSLSETIVHKKILIIALTVDMDGSVKVAPFDCNPLLLPSRTPHVIFHRKKGTPYKVEATIKIFIFCNVIVVQYLKTPMQDWISPPIEMGFSFGYHPKP